MAEPTGVIGDISLLSLPQHRTVRSMINHSDKSSVVSIFPKELNEKKPTIQPGFFHIPAGTPEKPSIVVVGPSSWWKEDYNNPNSPLLEVPVFSIQVAKSIVDDYCNGLLACDMASAMPGLFYIPGSVEPKDLTTKYKTLYDKALARQRTWFQALVKMGDNLWNRSNGNPLSISEDMKMAAITLGLTDKEWLTDHLAMAEKGKCPACGFMRDTQYPMCPNCHTVVDQKKFDSLGLTKSAKTA